MCSPDRLIRAGAIGVLLTLAGCGDLPQPFLGRPGATAMRLAQPPPSRLAIPLPTASLLTDGAARVWSQSLADALVAQELPVRTTSRDAPGDWRLLLTAEMQNGAVVPTYTVLNPRGEALGSSQGASVPAADWAAGQPATLKAAADAEAPKVVAMLTAIEARRQMSDPHSLLNRPPVVYFKGVSGAPGDGNTSLARLVRAKLPMLGDVVQDSPGGADFTVEGQVKTAQGAGNTERIELQWIVTDDQGRERGRVVQLNEVPPGSLDSYWGEVAVVVTNEASGGIHEVVTQATGRGTNATPAAGSTPGSTAPALPAS